MGGATQRATIRHGSERARKAMQALDAKMVEQLRVLYEEAAQAVRAAIAARADASNTVPMHNLRDLLRQIEDVIDRLGQQRNALLTQELATAAGIGLQPFGLGMDAAMRINQDAVRFVLGFTAADGLTLSDRVWRLDRGAKEAITRAIGQAVVSGWDAARAVREYMGLGQSVPLDVAQRLNGAKQDVLERYADLLTGDGGEVWKAERVFRTELNRAHGTAYMDAAEKTPGFVGFKFLLSPLHPKPDICDLLASQNLYGLGDGVYPSAKECPWPAHPNTLSFVQIVFADEVTDADRAGRETVTDAMGRMSPAVREGILGVEKAALYDAGMVKPWMIRSPLYAVKQRIARTGG